MEVLSAAIVSIMTPTIGKRVVDPGAELELELLGGRGARGVVRNSDNHTVMKTPLQRQPGLESLEISFKIGFSFPGLSNGFQRLAT